jgi:glycosyltransferase involved in cell wall biosynthesis
VSHDARRTALSHGISADRIRVIHNGINVEGFIEKSDVCNDDNEQDSLVAVARLSPEKGISMLLRAVALLRDSIPELQLEIAGSGPCHAELLHEASELGIEGQVTFLGQVTHPGEVLGRGRIFVLPSLSEGISLTLLESMAMGIPVIATNVGGNSEVIKDGYTGLLVPDSDPQTLADAIRKLWYDSDLRFQLALAAKQNVAEMFHVQRMIHQYEQLYRGVGLTHEYRNVDDASFLEHQVAAGENL